jgi:hypothetical protein
MCIICIYVFLFIHPRYQSEIRWKMDYNHSNEPLAIWDACPSGVNWEWVDVGGMGCSQKDFIKMSLGQSLWGLFRSVSWNIETSLVVPTSAMKSWAFGMLFFKKNLRRVYCIHFKGWLAIPSGTPTWQFFTSRRISSWCSHQLTFNHRGFPVDFPAMIFRTEKRSSPTVKRSQNQHPLGAAPRARTRPVSSAVIPSFQTLGSFAYSALHRLWLVVQKPSWKMMEFVNGVGMTSHIW